jgi:chromosome segregation ATPase
MKQPSLIPERPSEQGREMIAEKLKELEARIKATVALLAKIREEKVVLGQRIEELQATIKGQMEQMKALEAERKKEREQFVRMQEEREEVRLRVDRLLEEVARIEASVEPEV